MQSRKKALLVRSAALVVGSLFAGSALADSYNGQFGPGSTWSVYEVVPANLTWDEARVAAASKSLNGTPGRLVSIHSAAENSFVDAIAGGDWWIGLTDSDATSTLDGATMLGTEAGSNQTTGWVWVSGEPLTYTNWGGGEPNDWQGGTPPGEDAVHKSGSTWNDNAAGATLASNDGKRAGYIIEYPVNSATPAFAFQAPAGAPKGGMGTIGIREVIDNGGMGDQRVARDSIASGAGTIVNYQSNTLDIFDSDNRGHFTNNIPGAAVSDKTFGVVTAGLRSAGSVDDIAMVAQGTIKIDAAGTYTFGVNSDDGFTLLIKDNSFTNPVNADLAAYSNGTAIRYFGGRGAADSLGQVNLSAGEHEFILYYHEGGGGASVELFAAKGAYTAFDRSQFNLVGGPAIDLVKKGGRIDNGWEVAVIRNGANNLPTAIQQVEAHWAGTAQPNTTLATLPVINLMDPEGTGGGHGLPQTAFPGDNANADDNFAVGARSVFTIDPGDEDFYTFMVLGDDGSRFRLGGTSGWIAFGGSDPVGLADGFQLNGCCSDGFGQVFLNAGSYPAELIWNEIGGGAYVGLWVAKGKYSAFDDRVFQLLGENTSGSTHVDAGLALVPEPGTIGLLGAGALLLAGRRRNRASA